MSRNDATTVVSTEDYRGHTIELRYTPEQKTDTWSWAEHYDTTVDGRGFQGLTQVVKDGDHEKPKAKVLASARRAIDGWIADDNIRPSLARIVRTVEDPVGEGWSSATTEIKDLSVGLTVAAYSRGRVRVGLITKVGKTNAEFAYVTPSSPSTITRKSLPAKSFWLPTADVAYLR